MNKTFIFSEVFGDKTHPAILLNAGARQQSLAWPDQLCMELADKKYFVIRYDYRNTGLSTAISYEKQPYNALDLARDAIQVLKNHNVNKAHLVGFSMGGQIAQVACAHMPEYVQSLTLIATSTDFQITFDALEGTTTSKSNLTAPKPEYIEFSLNRNQFSPDMSLEEAVKHHLQFLRMLDGFSETFEESFFKTQWQQCYERDIRGNHTTCIPHPHFHSMKHSYDVHANALKLIKAPTLIIHGAKDPVFQADHAEDLLKRISSSTLTFWDDFGHVISPKNVAQLVNTLNTFIKRCDKIIRH
jgi:pimeloyl-ACP methyl ester carboxylesterase